MSITVDAVFDGEVLRPQQPLDLTPGEVYSITIEIKPASVTGPTLSSDAPNADGGNVWDYLESIMGTIDGPVDWSAEHDHDIYGTPKRGDTK